MAHFKCEICGADILEGTDGWYITGCEHYPLTKKEKEKNNEKNNHGNSDLDDDNNSVCPGLGHGAIYNSCWARGWAQDALKQMDAQPEDSADKCICPCGSLCEFLCDENENCLYGRI